MATVTQAFEDFMRRLELTDPEQDRASRQHNGLRSWIRGQLDDAQYDFIAGSYARRTAIRPLHDIGLFLVLDPRVHAERHGKQPEPILDRVRSTLQRCFPAPGADIRMRGRAVHITFAGTGIGYDIIPALPLIPGAHGPVEDRIYEVPDCTRSAWIKTNPGRHQQRCIDANQRAGGMLHRLIKAAKHWNHSQGDEHGGAPLRSLHLEVMAYDAFGAKPADERRGLRELFGFLKSRVAARCPDPAGLGPDIDAGLGPDERRRIQQKLTEAACMASEAVWYEDRGDHVAACSSWRSLLGEQFRS